MFKEPWPSDLYFGRGGIIQGIQLKSCFKMKNSFKGGCLDFFISKN